MPFSEKESKAEQVVVFLLALFFSSESSSLLRGRFTKEFGTPPFFFSWKYLGDGIFREQQQKKMKNEEEK